MKNQNDLLHYYLKDRIIEIFEDINDIQVICIFFTEIIKLFP